MLSPLPPSLRTANPAAGLDLARRLAAEIIAALPAADSMPDLLKTRSAGRPAPELVTAVYFHAISLANAGWQSVQ